MEVQVRNASEALTELLSRMKISGVSRESRAGTTIEINGPVIVGYQHPNERLIFWPERDFPCIFVLMESIWMMAGREDVKWLSQFNKRMASYSDDGKTFSGAYGHRWRNAFNGDQLHTLSALITQHPDTRRAVLQMWDSDLDLHPVEDGYKDVCCNLLVKFQKRYSYLDMTVFNRSNDLIWGTTTANSTHFSVLHEYMAASVGLSMGKYYQISDNLHVYKDLYDKYKNLSIHAPDPYRSTQRTAYANGEKVAKIVTHPETFLTECEKFCAEVEEGTEYIYRNEFFYKVARPMANIHKLWRNKKDPLRFSKARELMYSMPDCDWRTAVGIWIQIREQKAGT